MRSNLEGYRLGRRASIRRRVDIRLADWCLTGSDLDPEMTLSFIPKLAVMLLALVLLVNGSYPSLPSTSRQYSNVLERLRYRYPMNLVAAELIDLLNTFMWLFIRVSAAFLVAPIFSMGAINLRTRIMMGFIITMMIYPGSMFNQRILLLLRVWFCFQRGDSGSLDWPLFQVVLAAIIVSGQAILRMGLSMANMVDPNLGNVPTVSQLLLILGLLLLALGGHLILITIIAEVSSQFLLVAVCLEKSVGRIFILDFADVHRWYFFGPPVVFGLLMVNVCLGVVSRASAA